MIKLFNKRVTIYNDMDIPEDSINPRRFDRFVIDKCSDQGGYVEKADGTIQNIINAKTVITKDVEHYITPLEYKKLSVDEKEHFYTVQIGDFVVLAEVEDVVASSREFEALQRKYSNNGIKVTSVTANIHGMAVDNVTITNA